MTIARAPRLRRGKPGKPRTERAPHSEGWIARGADGCRLPGGEDFIWNTRSGAWHVCAEDDYLNGPEERKKNGLNFNEDGIACRRAA